MKISLIALLLINSATSVAFAAERGEDATGLAGIAGTGLAAYRSPHAPGFREAVRKSVYVSARDGTRLAVDYYLPSNAGKPIAGRYPTLFVYERYTRGSLDADGNLVTRDGGLVTRKNGIAMLDENSIEVYPSFLRQGYAVVIAEVRGAGASFGTAHHEGDVVEGRDGKDLVDWIAAQSWSDGAVGMYGISYLAELQPRVAAERPKALKALSMTMAFFDGANNAYSMGGIYRVGWLGAWTRATAADDSRTAAKRAGEKIQPVDADRDRTLLNAAIEQHQVQPTGDSYLQHLQEFTSVGVLRDRLAFLDRYQASGQNNLSTFLPQVNAAQVPALLIGGWSDLYATDMLHWYGNLTAPRRLIYGPYAHGVLGPGVDPRDRELTRIRTVETLRWFDYWLKGIKNDAMTRPAVQFGLPVDQRHTQWYAADSWPPPRAKAKSFYFSSGRTGTVRSQNDGALSAAVPASASADKWTVSYETTTGTAGTRWYYKTGVFPIDMTINDYRSLTYTTEPLTQDTALVGSPVVDLYLSSDNAPLVDVYVYLTEVLADGSSHLITEGMLRSSHRTLGKPPYNNFGDPFPSSQAHDVEAAPPLGSTPVKLRFPLIATGKIFKAGNRIRVTVSGTDKGNTTTPELEPAPRLILHSSAALPSRIELPLLPAERTTE
jgi:uncharacterized protein